MNAPSWLADPWVSRLGWTLIQFLWQGVVIAGVFAIVRGACARSLSSRSRYALACATLALMTLAPILTFLAGAGVGSASARWFPPVTSGWDSFMPALVAVWLCGVLALSIRLLGGWFAARNLRTCGVRPAPAHWQETFDRLCERLDISQRVRLLISPRIEVPVVVGWLRPVVLVPLGALTGLPPEYVMALLAHELAHVCRRDYLVNLLQHVAEAMLFYHPATWWVSAQIRIEREMCCDDIAVATQGDPLVYARALTELDTSRRAWRTLEVAANGPSLLHRIRRLLGHTVSPWQLPGPGALVVIGLLWLVGVAAVAARTERPIAVPGRAAAPAGVETADSRGASGLLATALLGPIGPPHPAQPSRPLATGSGRAVAVDSGEQSSQDDMDQTSTIRGRVTSAATGLPLRNATVQLLPSSPSEARGLSALTDEDGRYELSGVTPGHYNVNAQKAGFLAGYFGRRSPRRPGPLEATGGRTHDDIDMALPAGGVITGVVLDAAGDPLASVVVGARQAEFINGVPRPYVYDRASDVTDDLGRYRLFGLEAASYFLVALPSNPNSSRNVFLSPASPVIFYPGTSRSTEAQPVRVEIGRELTAPPFTVVPARAAKVSGAVTRQDGKALGHVDVSLHLPGTTTFPIPDHILRLPRPQAVVKDGAFVFPRVPPGEYTLVARSHEDGVALATSPLVIEGSDLTVPPLVLRRTSTLRGRVTFDVGAPTIQATQASAFVKLRDEGSNFATGIPIWADWSFEVTGLSGRQRFDVNLPAGWALTIRAGDQDLMDASLEFDGRDIDNVELRLTQRSTVISGRVSGLQPGSSEGVVLIFPEDPDRWRAVGSSRIKLAPIDESGRYRAEGLVPGNYLAVALESFERSDLSALDRFAPVATALTIAEAEQRALDLRLVFK